MRARTGVQYLFTPIEEAELETAIARGLEFGDARRKLVLHVSRLPWLLIPWSYTYGFLRTVSAATDERLWGRGRPTVPFGWSAEKCHDRNAWEIGPTWYILPRRWYREIRWRFYKLAIDIGAATGPEGCYFTEIEWWPKGPRLSRMERWEVERRRRSA